ncbi:hypothetical protein V6N11_001723 [Hibiscus sabdariffa]|uniref:Uncharacterized protein n=1 Tax=Hibiscus sabdariffa TaxID=183260 RepID=A0ABR2NRB5_9ROSI
MPENAALKNDGRRMLTRSFVFDDNAIKTLVLKAKSKSLEHPSRALAIINIRLKLKPRLPSYSIGNMFGMAISMYNPVGKDIDLSELAYLLREATESDPQHNAIEAWVTLSDKEMSFLERDAEFLTFASPNSYFHKSKI